MSGYKRNLRQNAPTEYEKAKELVNSVRELLVQGRYDEIDDELTAQYRKAMALIALEEKRVDKIVQIPLDKAQKSASQIAQETRSLVKDTNKRLVEENRHRLQEKYRMILPYEVIEELMTGKETELDKCLACKGLPCAKVFDKNERLALVKDGKGIILRSSPCEYFESAKKNAAVKSARIPKRYVGKTLSDYDVDRNNAAAVDYAKNSLELECGAFLYGSYGTGKTFLAAIIAQEWLRAGKSVIFIKVPALLDDVRATYNGVGNEADIYKEISRADLLVLDDLGMEKPSRHAGTTLCKIIDDRYDNEAATIITSNNKPAQIAIDLNNAVDGKNLNGSRIVDRLKELCPFIELKGGSRR